MIGVDHICCHPQRVFIVIRRILHLTAKSRYGRLELRHRPLGTFRSVLVDKSGNNQFGFCAILGCMAAICLNPHASAYMSILILSGSFDAVIFATSSSNLLCISSIVSAVVTPAIKARYRFVNRSRYSRSDCFRPDRGVLLLFLLRGHRFTLCHIVSYFIESHANSNPNQLDKYATIKDSATASMKSQPESNSTASVPHIVQHIGHSAIPPQTAYAFSMNPI